MARRRTNTATVRDIMEHSNYGALSQAFVMEAISRYAELVSKADPKNMAISLISDESWIGVAKEIKGKLDTHFAS